MKSLLCIMLLLYGVVPALAQPLPEPSLTSPFICTTSVTEECSAAPKVLYQPAWPYLSYLEDKSGEWTVEDLVAREDFRPLTAHPQFGQTKSHFWLKLDFTDSRQLDQQSLILHIDNPITDHIQLYRVSSSGKTERLYHVGDRLPFAERPLEERTFLLPLVNHQKDDTYLIHVWGASPLMLPIEIGNYPGVLKSIQRQSAFSFLVSGVIFAMLMYNIFLLVGTRKGVYGWYTLYVGSAWCYTLFTTGIGFQYLWPTSVAAQNTIAYFFVSIFQFSSFNFSRKFLRIHEFYPRLDWWVALVSKIPIITMVGAALGLTVVFKLTSLATLLTVLLIPALSVMSLMRGHKPALIFLFCWLFLIVGMLTYNITLAGGLPINFYTVHAIELGVSFEAVLLSFALAYSIRTADREAKQARGESQRSLEKAFHEKEAALAMAKASNEAKTAFLKNISHHVKTPIHGIYGNLQLLEGGALCEEQAQGLASIKDNTVTLFYYLDNLLTYAEILGNNIYPIEREIDVEYEVLAVVKLWQNNHRGNTVSLMPVFNSDLPRSIETVWGHQDKLLRVLFDTLLLPLKNKEATLNVAQVIEQGKPFLQFTFQGLGLENDTILTNWVRTDLSPDEWNSLGLEYYIGRKLIQSLQAETAFECMDDGTYSFQLRSPCKAEIKQLAFDKLSEFPGIRALVVDDNEVNLQVMTALLKRLDVETDTALSGEEALEKTNIKRYNVILMDCFMPGLSGQETSKLIREKSANHKTCPILAVSANTSDNDRLSCFAAGMNDFIEKPVSLDKLARYLSRWSKV